uniref:PB1 domain-containing protein n=1 Tax=Setaria digitata TaxID=48799 RepID=A0A915PUA4_9BILA
MKQNCGDLKIKWNHHGHKYKLILTQQELAEDDVFEILLRKIRRQRPDFNEVLASYDKHGSENIVATDNEFRQLLPLRKGEHLKVYTIRRCLAFHPLRSHSIPLDITRLKHIPLRSTSCMRGPPPSYRESQEEASLQIPTSYHTLPRWGTTPFSHINSNFGCIYAHYDSATMPTGSGSRRYGQSLIYGYPPQLSMMYNFLCSPFPFGGHHRNWICGPKCLALSLGGKNHRPKYTSWWNTIF